LVTTQQSCSSDHCLHQTNALSPIWSKLTTNVSFISVLAFPNPTSAWVQPGLLLKYIPSTSSAVIFHSMPSCLSVLKSSNSFYCGPCLTMEFFLCRAEGMDSHSMNHGMLCIAEPY
jgi:hypothetical protein